MLRPLRRALTNPRLFPGAFPALSGTSGGALLSTKRTFAVHREHDPAKVQNFIDTAFEYFDDNQNGIIEYFEIQKAYMEKGAGVKMFKMFVDSGLGRAPPGGRCE